MLNINSQPSLRAINQLRQTQQQLDVSFQRLASGQRINRAADDAAGLQISQRLTSDITSGRQVSHNLNDGISYAQTAEGGLQQISAALQRMRMLAVQAQNGINSQSDRQALDKEVQQLKTEIDAIARGTVIFNRQPWVGDVVMPEPPDVIDSLFPNGERVRVRRDFGTEKVAEIPVGLQGFTIDFDSFGWDDDLQIFTRDGLHLIGTGLGDQTWNDSRIRTLDDMNNLIITPANGFNAGASYQSAQLNQGGVSLFNGMTLSFSGDRFDDTSLPLRERWLEFVSINQVTEPLILLVSGRGAFDATLRWTGIAVPPTSETSFEPGPVDITSSIQRQGDDVFIRMQKTPATLRDLDLQGLALDPLELAEEALFRIDRAIEQVGTFQSFYGAKMNQMLSAKRNVEQTAQNLAAARAQITDTDFASETTTLTQQQIVEQASVAVLSQANAQPQQVLALLQSVGG